MKLKQVKYLGDADQAYEDVDRCAWCNVLQKVVYGRALVYFLYDVRDGVDDFIVWRIR